MPARDVIAIEELAKYGQGTANIALTFTPLVAANDAYFLNDGNVILVFHNSSSGGAEIATVISVADEDGRTGDITVTVPAASGGGVLGIATAGPFSPALYNQIGASDLGKVFVDTLVADLSVCALHFVP